MQSTQGIPFWILKRGDGIVPYHLPMPFLVLFTFYFKIKCHKENELLDETPPDNKYLYQASYIFPEVPSAAYQI